MESNAVGQLKSAATVSSTMSSLEDAVRTLLVSMHSCELPPMVQEAAGLVTGLLPVGEPSADHEEGMIVDEKSIKPATLGEALLVDPNGTADEPHKRAWQDLESEESEQDLLSWAKRVNATQKGYNPY